MEYVHNVHGLVPGRQHPTKVPRYLGEPCAQALLPG